VVEVVVRLADRGSAAELTALHRAVAQVAYADIFPPEAPPPSYEEDLARWEHWLGSDWEQGRRAHVAATRGRVVGVILAGPDPDESRVGHIARLYVDPPCWGRGIGTLLYDAALADLTGRDFREATLWVLEANRRARDWYERLGWRTTGRRKPVYAPAGIEDVQYRIDLPTRSGARRQVLGEEVEDDLGSHPSVDRRTRP
jgi:ribosomal protein S18 acetylase RimI-like enzyme